MTVGERDLGFKQRSYQHRAAGSEHAVIEPLPVPGRVGVPVSQWPDEGTVATGKIVRDELTASEPCVEVRVGGMHGVRAGWAALLPLRDGTTIVGKVVEVSDKSCRIVVPSGRDLELGATDAYLWKSS